MVDGNSDTHGVWGWEGIRWNVTRATRRQLVSVNEESSVGVTGVEREHSVVDILLGTFGAIARSQESAGRVWSQASFQASSLSVVVMTVSVILGNVLKNNSPKSFNVQSSLDLDVVNLARTQVSFGSNPEKRQVIILTFRIVDVNVYTIHILGNE